MVNSKTDNMDCYWKQLSFLYRIHLGNVIILLLLAVLLVNTGHVLAGETIKPKYIGYQQCIACHRQQVDAWKGSHHDLAMQHANGDTILGDFNNAKFKYNGITSTFFKKNNQYFVKTDGPDGKLQDYQILYTFGIDPLQQYLIAFPNGRLQALGIAWDNRPTGQGGQRWFHLYPDEKIDHQDELHWSKLSQNWNHMCAECHSTNLQKNFDVTTNRFNTSWSEINVSCESCHGPASRHVDWAKKKNGWGKIENKGLQILLDEREGVSWTFHNKHNTASRNQSRTTMKEINTCARCHARRSTLTEDYQYGKSLHDSHLPALLTEQLYHADGQIKDEVFVYGSFLQSKMFHKGVTCSDCHEPHSLKLRAPANQVCLQCHQADKYNAETHHFHKLGSKGASCAECHMPPKHFMIVDARHDHSIRIPRPDLSLSLNTPNACNNCHTEKTPAWANTQMEKWYGKDWSPGWHFGETLFDGRQGLPQAGQDLVAMAVSPKVPDIARATATSLLPNYLNRLTLTLLPKLLSDKSASVRQAALSTVDNLEPQHRWRLAGELLSDPVLTVRIEAARVLSIVGRDSLTMQQQQLLSNVLNEYVATQQANAEHPQSHVNLGLVYTRLRKTGQAEVAYQQAIKLDPAYAAAYVNLADLYRLQQQDDKVKATLLQARTNVGRNPDVEHALGLYYVRNKQMPKAVEALAIAVALQPENVRYSYVYALALKGEGNTKEAIKILKGVHVKNPYDRDILIALVTYLQAQGDINAATAYAQKLVDMDPQYGSVQQLLEQLSSR